ncbi:MAG TPA: 2-amino-4-hydroxy-6-hydroxymethyldihydropteridine diphosphokinase [Gammaproteobacteria bacterium]
MISVPEGGGYYRKNQGLTSRPAPGLAPQPGLGYGGASGFNPPWIRMDKLYIQDLQIDTVIGVYDWEREIRQTVSFDLEMATDARPGAASDRVDDVLNYKPLAKRLIQYVSESRYQLIETLAQRVAEIILYEFNVQWVKLRLNKPGALRYSRNVGVEIIRERVAAELRPVYISIGSNIEAERNIRSALSMLRLEFGELRLSTLYRNPAVGFPGEDFLNLVVGLNTALPLAAVLQRLDYIETTHGRDPAQTKFSSRTLDLDLLLYGDTVCQQPLNLPRVDILRYAFVLKPLSELAGDQIHPLERKSYRQLWREFKGEQALEAVDSKVIS